MNSLAAALIDQLDDAALDALDERLASRVIGRIVASLAKEPDPWLNSDQAARHLACPRGRIDDLVQPGKLEAHRDGRRLLFCRSYLEAWLSSLTKLTPHNLWEPEA